jgi:hypothetical protein
MHFLFQASQERINTDYFKIWSAYTLDTLSKLSFRPRREISRLLCGVYFFSLALSIFAHVSRNVTVRLKTSELGEESALSTEK